MTTAFYFAAAPRAPGTDEEVILETQVWAEVITIGSELVLGQLVDTNAAYIAVALSEIGVGMAYHTTVGDDRARMAEAMSRALDRCQIVIVTGGLGPTEDDLTREVTAEVMGRDLVFRQDLMDDIEDLFQRAGFRMAPNNRRQAYIPEGAEVIHNPRGTAPAFRVNRDDRVIICLPGVPAETEPLLREEVLPYLQDAFSPNGRIWVNRILKVFAVGESTVDDRIGDIIRASENPVIGLQASPGEIKVRLTARAESQEDADGLLNGCEGRIRERLGDLIFGYGSETLSGNIAGMIETAGRSLVVLDQVTRGQVAYELGTHLGPERFKGCVMAEGPAASEKRCRQAMAEFGADLGLCLNGHPEGDKIRAEAFVLGPGRGRSEREMILGGPFRLIRYRALTLGLFTLFAWLNQPGETAAG